MQIEDDDAMLAEQIETALKGLAIASSQPDDKNTQHSRVAEISRVRSIVSVSTDRMSTGERKRKVSQR